ncbi:hypothetical protein G6F57_017863 [Rhizopus arrhizus]|uniref:Uncharacterized protein n=1 Tax=Rhizopus oryzae TaxID=64495 RepID=A0A9P7BJX4_RHIOR|nr:hypothetical protein G6F23_013130 [Rhizopus arrhizus]KAG0751413.1 hypothetical protein G6F24_014348 [Rhizopus arrhizus]KAG0772008.1 hypothetical protein G6F22_016038 [Rhizopus arrhizus]KAG0777116.1 hypothetical protein G6F21_013444 [Rhizopus arrhizus]KAG0845391.1 hypothetical protein G6F17_013495 [Rhizopus arrhizus]
MEEVEEDIQLNQIGTTIEEDMDTLDEVEQKTTLEDGDVGPQPSTPTIFPTILTVQHHQILQHQILQHQDLPVNSNAKHITGNICLTITTTITISTTTPTTTTTTLNYTITSDGILPGG